MTTISWLLLFREIIAVYAENYTKLMNTLCGHSYELFKLSAIGTHTYHCALKG